MGAIGDALNPPREFVVGGQTVEVKRISFNDLYSIMGESLKELGIAEVGTDLENSIQTCLETGEVPKCALPRILKRGAVTDLDEDDVDALMQVDTLGEIVDVVAWMMGGPEKSEQVEQPEGEEKKSP